MKRIFLPFVLVLFTSNIFAQAMEQGVWSINLGYEAGIHATFFDNTYGSINDKDTSAAGTQMGRFDLHFNVLNPISLGLHFKSGSYIEDPENATTGGNKISIFGLGLRAFIVNKDKFNWFAGLNFGSTRLEVNRNYTFIVTWTEKYLYRGSNFDFETGFNWYFVEHIGLNFNLGYTSNKMKMTEYYINNDPQDMSNKDFRLHAKGMTIGIGASIYFGGN